jgi:hypothetical protein
MRKERAGSTDHIDLTQASIDLQFSKQRSVSHDMLRPKSDPDEASLRDRSGNYLASTVVMPANHERSGAGS